MSNYTLIIIFGITGESIDSIYEGKLITCTVTGIARKRPQHDVIARANPIQDRVTGYWQCPFCLRSDFPDISLVCLFTQGSNFCLVPLSSVSF